MRWDENKIIYSILKFHKILKIEMKNYLLTLFMNVVFQIQTT